MNRGIGKQKSNKVPGIQKSPKQIGHEIDDDSHQKQTVVPLRFGELMSVVIPKNITINDQQEKDCQNPNDWISHNAAPQFFL